MPKKLFAHRITLYNLSSMSNWDIFWWQMNHMIAGHDPQTILKSWYSESPFLVFWEEIISV